MTQVAELNTGPFAAMLVDNLREVTEELRTIDVVDLVSFIRYGSYTAIDDLIHSSTELFFRQGSLMSAWTACVDLAWETLPTITLGMEFRHPVVSVFFDLLIGAGRDAVKVRGMLFEEPCETAGDRLRLLSRAIDEARLPQRTERSVGLPNQVAGSDERRLLPR